MSIIRRLWWFFRLEKRRYLIGIFSLSLHAKRMKKKTFSEIGNHNQRSIKVVH
ncbi:hypothetical protein [Streptococcus hyointestinalis]|uniref:hypothetical protein n=1 Tax=Streptococcus hyointestinalis TaxID=1337 RepID=UPI003F9AFF7B